MHALSHSCEDFLAFDATLYGCIHRFAGVNRRDLSLDSLVGGNPRSDCFVEGYELSMVAEESLHFVDGFQLCFLSLDELLVRLEVSIVGDKLIDVV